MGKKIIVDRLSEYTYQRLLKQKETDGFKDKSWKDWLIAKASPNLILSETESVRKATGNNLRKMWGENIGFNLAYIRRPNMKSLRDIPTPQGESALVVAGGPSIAIHNQIETLSKAVSSGCYKGQIIACDKMLIPLLKAGITPDYVLSVDGSPIIFNFFKHRLVKENINKIKFVVHIATNPKVTRYLYRNKAQVYWFLAHQVYTSEEEVENSDAITLLGMTSTKHHPKGIQTCVAAGNVGVCSFAFSWVILHKRNLALIGFDMGYPEGTALEKTYYYSSYIEATQKAFGKNMFASLTAQIDYEKEYNPAWHSYSFTDRVFRSYRNMFYDLLDILPANVTVTSCVEGGTLYHPKLKYATLKEWFRDQTS